MAFTKGACQESALLPFEAFYEVRPRYDCSKGERIQTGFEIELIGSHSEEDGHLDPSCQACHKVQNQLVAVAEIVTSTLQATGDRAVTCEIYCHRKRPLMTV